MKLPSLPIHLACVACAFSTLRADAPRHPAAPRKTAPPAAAVAAEAPVNADPHLSEVAKRRWMNEHIIASNIEGTAMDPYSCIKGPPLKLQVRFDDKDGVKTMAALGLKDNAEFAEPKQLIYRDYVVPHMLKKARESGKPIVIFAHGGLNFLDAAIKRAVIECPIAEKSCYPIYVCWDSSFSTSYWEHLTSVRNGTSLGQDDKWWAGVTWPLYLATDLATSVVRTPRILTDLGRSNLKGWSWPHVEKLAYPTVERPWFPDGRNDRNFGDIQDATVRYYALKSARGSPLTPQEEREKERFRKKLGAVKAGDEEKRVDKAGRTLSEEWAEMRQSGGGRGPMAVDKGEYHPELGDSTMRILEGWAMVPFKLGIVTAFAGAGTDMWDVMSRRTHVMYHYESGYRPAWGSAEPHASYRETNFDVRDSESTGIGCLSVFFRKLAAEQRAGHCRKVTLVGHSMGAIIFNDALREFPGIHYDAIVYLAAACSIRDFYNTAIPYLERKDHARTQFYGLSLHPRAEDRDIMFGEFVPRGSLLIWIDEFLGHPQSFTDRTLGHFDNALLASRLYPPRLQKRLHFTALATGPARKEMSSHGDFSSANFWKPGFYEKGAAVPRKSDPEYNLDLPFYKKAKEANARYYLPRAK